MSKDYKYVFQGLDDNRFRPLPWLIFTGFIVALGSFLFANNRFTVVGINENLTELGPDVFLKYLFIVIAVERAAAVFVGMLRGQGNIDWSLRINRITEVLKKDDPSIEVLKQVYTRERRLTLQLEESGKIGEIENVPEPPNKEDYIGFLTSTKYAYEFQRARFNSVSNRTVARIVFFVGIILATLGISVFQDLLQNMNLVSVMEEEVKNGTLTENGLLWQSGLLRFADVLVTGGLLGGGSTALNALANKVTVFLNKS